MNSKNFVRELLHYKSGSPIRVDAGAGLVETATNATTLPSVDAWQEVGSPFDCTGWARICVMALTNRASNKVRLVFGRKDSDGVFVPMAVSSEATLTASAPGDALSCEAVGPWAQLEAYNNSGNLATIDCYAQGRMVS